MEFNDIVTLILFLLFFILPSVVRGLGKKRKKPFAPKKKKRKLSLFGKVGEAVQEFIRELEKQAMEAKRQQAEKDGTFWDEMGEEEMEIAVPEAPPAPAPVEKKVTQPYVSSDSARKKTAAPPTVPTIARTEGADLPGLKGRQGRTALQNAVVWAEILGKPIALRKD